MFRQSAYLSCGMRSAREAAERGDIIIVDVVSFSLTVISFKWYETISAPLEMAN